MPEPYARRSPTTLTQFAFTDYDVAYQYLTNPESLALPQTTMGSPPCKEARTF